MERGIDDAARVHYCGHAGDEDIMPTRQSRGYGNGAATSNGRNELPKSPGSKHQSSQQGEPVVVPFDGDPAKNSRKKSKKRFRSKKENGKAKNKNIQSYAKDGIDRAIVEDHVKNALRKDGMGPDITSSSQSASTDRVGNYVVIALLVVTMGAMMVVLLADIDGLDGLYDFLDSNPIASFMVFTVALGVPAIILACFILSICRKRERGAVVPYDKPYAMESFDPSMEKSPENSKIIEMEAELGRRESARRFDDDLFLEDEDDQSAVAENYL